MIITIMMHVTRNKVPRNSDYESDKRKNLLIYMNCLRKSFVFQRIRGFFKCYALYKSTFYLLTYYLSTSGTHELFMQPHCAVLA